MSKQHLAGLCGPRHTWEEFDQEKSRSFYSEAVSKYGPYSYNDTGASGDGDLDYAGEEAGYSDAKASSQIRVPHQLPKPLLQVFLFL